jgi:hypothetical protein
MAKVLTNPDFSGYKIHHIDILGSTAADNKPKAGTIIQTNQVYGYTTNTSAQP